MPKCVPVYSASILLLIISVKNNTFLCPADDLCHHSYMKHHAS